jgi:hypothetical protein
MLATNATKESSWGHQVPAATTGDRIDPASSAIETLLLLS